MKSSKQQPSFVSTTRTTTTRMLCVSLLLVTIVRYGQSFSPVARIPTLNTVGGQRDHTHVSSSFVNTRKIAIASTSTSRSRRPTYYMTSKENEEEEDVVMDISELAEEQIVEMVEVSFINACLQLSQGYVDVLKLFIVAVKASYENGTPPSTLVDKVANCPVNTAGRPLLPEELQLRSTWIQAIYLILHHIGHEGVAVVPKEEEDDTKTSAAAVPTTTVRSSADIDMDMIDASVRETYTAILPHVVELRAANGEFQADDMVEQHPDCVPTTTSPLEKAIVSQTIRVIWYTLVVLDEEKLVFGEHDTAPRPNIPYGDSNNGSMSSSSSSGGGGKGFGK